LEICVDQTSPANGGPVSRQSSSATNLSTYQGNRAQDVAVGSCRGQARASSILFLCMLALCSGGLARGVHSSHTAWCR